MLNKLIVICFIALLLIVFIPYYSKVNFNVYTYIQDTTCIIRTVEGNYGSGVFKRANGHTYVITARHVVEKTKFNDVTIIRHEYEGVKKYGELQLLAKITLKSTKWDLAILELYGKKPVSKSVAFHRNVDLPIGEKLILVGSPFGEFNYNSISIGILAQYDRSFEDKTFDESTTLVNPGSSGAGLFTENGYLVGIANARSRTGNCMFTPLRELYRWIEQENLQFLLKD